MWKGTIKLEVLVPGHKYPKMKGNHLYGGTDTHGCFAIYFFNPCFRVLMAWDKYHTALLGLVLYTDMLSGRPHPCLSHHLTYLQT